MTTHELRVTTHDAPRRGGHLFGPSATCVVRHFSLLVAILFVAGCTTAREERAELVYGAPFTVGREEEVSAAVLTTWQAPSFERNYHLGPSDVIEISIFQLLELNTNTTVTAPISEEGYVSLPLLGNVKAQGLTAQELEREIACLLEEGYLVDSQVSVVVKEHRSQSVLVFGAVARPGIYRLTNDETRVLGLLSQAGGVKPEAGDWLYVLRPGKEELARQPATTEGKTAVVKMPETQTIQVDLRRLLETGDQSLNVAIKHGDVVNVPPAEQGFFFASGAVMKPGIYPLRRRISVLQGLAVVGGLARRANPTNVQIIRGSGRPQEERIKLNVAELARGKKQEKEVFLQSGDLLVVSKQPLAGVGDFFERIFSLGVSANYDLTQ